MARQILSEVCRSYLIAVSAYRIWQGQPSRQAAFHDRHPAVAPAMGKLEHAREMLRLHRGRGAVPPVTSMLINNNANGHAGKRDAHNNDGCNGTDNIGHGSSIPVRVNRRWAQPLAIRQAPLARHQLPAQQRHPSNQRDPSRSATPYASLILLPQGPNGVGPGPSFARRCGRIPSNAIRNQCRPERQRGGRRLRSTGRVKKEERHTLVYPGGNIQS